MNILSVDDHHLFSEGLRMMIAQIDPELEFSHAPDCASALAMPASVARTVLLDFHLPDVTGFEGLIALRDHFPESKIVIISGEEQPGVIRETVSLGAAGYIPKSTQPDVLIAALQLVIAGGTYLPPHVLQAVDSGAAAEKPSLLDGLSVRQISVLKGAIQGKLNKVIADELNIAEGTVKAHLSAAFRALGVRNRTEAVYVASKQNLDLG